MYEKIFVIGFNKTATSTFHELFKQNGLSSQHIGGGNNWNIDKYQCFSDGGNLNNFKDLYLKYTNSIFILNVRNLEDRIISSYKHCEVKKVKYSWAWPPSEKLTRGFIDTKERYYLEVLKFFEKDPKRLIIVSINEKDWIKYIASKLKLKKNSIKSKNIRDKCDRLNLILDVVNKTFDNLQYNNLDISNILLHNRELSKKYIKLYDNNITNYN